MTIKSGATTMNDTKRHVFKPSFLYLIYHNELSYNKMTSDIPIAIDDPTRDRKIIIENFMREICLMDKDVNTGNSSPNVFSVSEIRDEVLRAFSLEYVIEVLQAHERENEPFIVFVDNDREKIQLTDAGRVHCQELRQQLDEAVKSGIAQNPYVFDRLAEL
jgi:hypothetical protein